MTISCYPVFKRDRISGTIGQRNHQIIALENQGKVVDCYAFTESYGVITGTCAS